VTPSQVGTRHRNTTALFDEAARLRSRARGQPKQRKENVITAEQTRLALKIDAYVKSIEARGGGDEEILTTMEPALLDFGVLMKSAGQRQVDLLATEHSGFRRFAVLLTQLAAGIQDGRIQVPRE